VRAAVGVTGKITLLTFFYTHARSARLSVRVRVDGALSGRIVGDPDLRERCASCRSASTDTTPALVGKLSGGFWPCAVRVGLPEARIAMLQPLLDDLGRTCGSSGTRRRGATPYA